MRTELHNNSLLTGHDSSIGNRGLARQCQESPAFSESLTAASDRLAEGKNASTAGQISGMIRTMAIDAVMESQRQSAGATSQQTSKDNHGSTSTIQTPFGPIERTGPGAPSGGSEPILDEMRVYFITHQPGEWIHDQATRDAFAKLYGEKALVTLDWLGTVPENNDAMWQTHEAVDANGFPIPKKITLGGTT